MQGDKQAVFFSGPRVFADVGVQMVMPSLTALFSDTTRQMRCNESPFHRAVGVDEINKSPILRLTPGTLQKLRVKHFLPAMEALDICFTITEHGCNEFPVSCAMNLHSFGESPILSSGSR